MNAISESFAQTDLSKAEYQSLAGATTSEVWNNAFRAILQAHGTPDHPARHPRDYTRRILDSGLFAAVVQRWNPPSASTSPLTDQEIAVLDGVQSSRALAQCKQAICRRRGGLHPSDWLSKMITSGRLVNQISTWAEPVGPP